MWYGGCVSYLLYAYSITKWQLYVPICQLCSANKRKCIAGNEYDCLWMWSMVLLSSHFYSMQTIITSTIPPCTFHSVKRSMLIVKFSIAHNQLMLTASYSIVQTGFSLLDHITDQMTKKCCWWWWHFHVHVILYFWNENFEQLTRGCIGLCCMCVSTSFEYYFLMSHCQ